MEAEMGGLEAQQFRGAEKDGHCSIFKKPKCPITLKFAEVVYMIKVKKPLFLSSKSSETQKQILKGVTGTVLPGEMLAMLGPSGSGKTTLLTALGGRLGGGLSGNITYNDKPFTNMIKRNMGFVTQDDVLYPHFTVTETMIFTALLRLPNTLTKEEKVMHAESVITQLGLTKCKNNIIGGPFVRGVSGGERKRVSIGQELLISPSILLLDEPTSGLDSTTAQRIVSMLWELTKSGRTIVMTIHQPSNRLFYMFHKVLLLSDGNPLYFGKGSQVMDYFSSIGYAPFDATNPSDFLLDLAEGVCLDKPNEDHTAVKLALVYAYKANLGNRLMKGEVKDIDNQFSDGLGEQEISKWTTTWAQQFSVLLRRGLQERKHESFSGLKVIQVMVVALLCGLLWWKSSIAHLQDQVGLLFFCAQFWGFFPVYQAIFTFPQERRMLIKERSSGMYRLSSYFIARTVGDLPMELVLPTMFITMTYWMAGLKPSAIHFVLTLFCILYNVLVAQGLGLALGALVMDVKSATTLGSVIMLASLIAGGYYVQHVPAFISWLKYINLSYHTYKLLLGSQYGADEMYPCGLNELCTVRSNSMIKMVGLDHQAVSIIALTIMLVGYRLISYCALIKVGVTR